MLVPTFMMYWKHRQRIVALQTTLSAAQQNRREDALRVMRLAETAPEQLTRAQRAAIEGKIAWRESVSSWRSPSRTPSGSVASSVSQGSGIKLGHLSKASTSSIGLRAPGDLEMAVPRVAGEREARQNTCSSLIGTQDRHDRTLGEPTGLAAKVVPATNQAVSSTPQNIASPADPVVGHARPTIATDQRVLDSQATSQHDQPARSPITQPTPTKLYGFHLPRPQAGQAYAMQEDGTRGNAVPSHGVVPPMPTITSSRQTPLPVPGPVGLAIANAR